jgi:hypothetical protein
MKMRRLQVVVLTATLPLVCAEVRAQDPVGTAFVYQGRLNDGGEPGEGPYDFLFRLFDASAGGNQVGSDVWVDDWPVSGGLFTAALDFGDSVFTGDARWLQVGVRPGPSEDPHTMLMPRQPINGTPYALYALDCASSDAWWQSAANGIYYNDGFVGIGTSSPTAVLSVYKPEDSSASAALRLATEVGEFPYYLTAYLYFDGHAIDAYYSGGTDGDVAINSDSSGDVTLATGGGYVGVGTDDPQYYLDVVGQAIMHTSSMGAGAVATYGPTGSQNATLGQFWIYPSHGAIWVSDSASEGQAGMYVDEDGQGVVWGDTKSFRVPNPNQPGTEIWYACLEGPEAAAYVRGTGHLVNGQAEVTFPEHFVAVANPQGTTVQVTPLSAESKGLAVVEKHADGFVVRELSSGTGTYDFDFVVMAVRSGHENFRVIRPSIRTMLAGPGRENELERRPAR